MQLKGKILAIDFGTKIVGVAITDVDQKFSLPYCEIKNDSLVFKKLLEIVDEEKIIKIIIGFPQTRNGYVSERHQLIYDFKKSLDEIFKNRVNIIFFDESFSTKSSYESLKNFSIKTSKLKKNKDMIAASIILENYLSSKK